MLGFFEALVAIDTRVSARAVPERAASRAKEPLTSARAEGKRQVLRKPARRIHVDENATACCPPLEEPLWNAHPRVYLPFDEAGIAKCPYCATEHRCEHAFLLAARLEGGVELEEFAKLTFLELAQLGRLADDASVAAGTESDIQAMPRYIAGAIQVLDQAMKSDPDECRVLNWFVNKHLKAFSMRTPAEVVAAGNAAALADYIKVIDVRYAD